MLWEVGTNSVQLKERKDGSLVPKRDWMKHLDFLSFLESRRSVISKPLAPDHSFSLKHNSLVAASHAYLAPESVAISYAIAKT